MDIQHIILDCSKIPTCAIYWCLVVLPDHNAGGVEHFRSSLVCSDANSKRKKSAQVQRIITHKPP